MLNDYSTEAVPIGTPRKSSSFKKRFLEITSITCTSCKDGGLVCFFHHNLLHLENRSLKNCHSLRNSSLLIIAREEYVSPSNISVAFSPQKWAKVDSLELP